MTQPTVDPRATTDAAVCPACGTPVTPDDAFCEACGARLGSAPATAEPVEPTDDAPIEVTQPAQDEPTVPVTRCAACGGVIGADGYCEWCGLKAPDPRQHWTERPAEWVAGCCDRGIKHHRNEDAMALAAGADVGGRAVLVVCDGVSTSAESDRGSLAAAVSARDALAARASAGIGTQESRLAALSAAMREAAAAANAAIVATTSANSQNPASCTFAAAILDGDLAVVGNVGDSRTYWLPDDGDPVQLSVDDSLAQARIAMGVPREDAENGPQAHAITKWLGRDSSDSEPAVVSVALGGPGWLLVCSDGLWNYASEAAELRDLVARFGAEAAGDPLPLAEALVQWACDQGGKDNVTAALARHG